MSTKNSDLMENEADVDLQKREFMGKVGKYAVGAGMATLMTPTLSTAGNYNVFRVKGNNGHGNGDQPAPGNSLYHNQAENTVPVGTPHNNGKFPDSDPLDIDPDGKPYPHYN